MFNTLLYFKVIVDACNFDVFLLDSAFHDEFVNQLFYYVFAIIDNSFDILDYDASYAASLHSLSNIVF